MSANFACESEGGNKMKKKERKEKKRNIKLEKPKTFLVYIYILKEWKLC